MRRFTFFEVARAFHFIGWCLVMLGGLAAIAAFAMLVAADFHAPFAAYVAGGICIDLLFGATVFLVWSVFFNALGNLALWRRQAAR